jgi:myosin-1
VRKGLHLSEPRNFAYLARNGYSVMNEAFHQAELGAVINSMSALGFSEDDQTNIFAVLAIVLHLGNVQFQERSGGSFVSLVASENRSLLELMRMDNLVLALMMHLTNRTEIHESSLLSALCCRNPNNWPGYRGTGYSVPLNEAQARGEANSLAMNIYSQLVTYIERRINERLCVEGVRKISLVTAPAFSTNQVTYA